MIYQSEVLIMPARNVGREGTSVLTVVQDTAANDAASPRSLLDEVVRDGVRQMLIAGLKAGVAAYIVQFADQLDENGPRLVVRNGYHAEREVLTAAGGVAVKAPRVNDKRHGTGERQRFSSAILPAWAGKSPEVAEVLRLLYLHGLSTGDFDPAPEQFLGSGAGLSAASITRLTTSWQDEAKAFADRDLSGTDYGWRAGVLAGVAGCVLAEQRATLLVP